MNERQMTIKFLRGGKYQTEPALGIKGKVIIVEEGEEYTGPYIFGYDMVEAGAAVEVAAKKIQETEELEDDNEPSDIELFLQSIVENADDDKGAKDALEEWAKREHDIDINKRKGIPKIIESIIEAMEDDEDSE